MDIWNCCRDYVYVSETAHDNNLRIGLWIIGGILTFLVLEKIFQDEESNDESKSETKEVKNICFYDAITVFVTL